jgi:hypothetical protein
MKLNADVRLLTQFPTQPVEVQNEYFNNVLFFPDEDIKRTYYETKDNFRPTQETIIIKFGASMTGPTGRDRDFLAKIEAEYGYMVRYIKPLFEKEFNFTIHDFWKEFQTVKISLPPHEYGPAKWSITYKTIHYPDIFVIVYFVDFLANDLVAGSIELLPEEKMRPYIYPAKVYNQFFENVKFQYTRLGKNSFEVRLNFAPVEHEICLFSLDAETRPYGPTQKDKDFLKKIQDQYDHVVALAKPMIENEYRKTKPQFNIGNFEKDFRLSGIQLPKLNDKSLVWILSVENTSNEDLIGITFSGFEPQRIEFVG